jgi:hypothetical protein
MFDNKRYQFLRVPAGLKGMSGFLQTHLEIKLGPYKATPYQDDIAIPTFENDDPIEKLVSIIDMLTNNHIRVNWKKTMPKLFRTEALILGRIVTTDSIRPDPQKSLALKQWRPPETKQKLQSYIGALNDQRSFDSTLGTKLQRLSYLIRKLPAPTSKVTWTETALEAFEDTKEWLKKDVELRMEDPNLPYIITTDASGIGVGAYKTSTINSWNVTRERLVL